MAAAIENDETMIINSDHSITTTPIESPQSDIAGTSKKTPDRRANQLQVESDETPTSDTSSSEAAAVKNKRHRPKARSESNRSEKYAKKCFFCSFTFPFSFLLNWVLNHFEPVHSLVFKLPERIHLYSCVCN